MSLGDPEWSSGLTCMLSVHTPDQEVPSSNPGKVIYFNFLISFLHSCLGFSFMERSTDKKEYEKKGKMHKAKLKKRDFKVGPSDVYITTSFSLRMNWELHSP